MRLCEAHVQRLERYRAKIQGPNGEGVQPVAVQVAILLDAVAVTDRGAAPRPWSELVATTELPSGMVTSKFATPEQREIYTLKRRIDGLESQVAKLRRELSEARGEQQCSVRATNEFRSTSESPRALESEVAAGGAEVAK